jgi:hypothetical protein
MSNDFLRDFLPPRRTKTTILPRIHLPARFKRQQILHVGRVWDRRTKRM